MSSSSMSHAGVVRAHTHSLGGILNVFSWLKNWYESIQFLAISQINFGCKSQNMVYSTFENVGGNLESLRGRFRSNRRIRPIGRLGGYFSDRAPGS